MKSVKHIVKINALKRFKQLRSKAIRFGSYLEGDDISADADLLNRRLIHFFDPQGYTGFAHQQHTNTHDYEITQHYRFSNERLSKQSPAHR